MTMELAGTVPTFDVLHRVQNDREDQLVSSEDYSKPIYNHVFIKVLNYLPKQTQPA